MSKQEKIINNEIKVLLEKRNNIMLSIECAKETNRPAQYQYNLKMQLQDALYEIDEKRDIRAALLDEEFNMMKV